MTHSDESTSRHDPMAHGPVAHGLELVVVGVAYFALAKLGLALASIHPSASPIWPSTGLALAAVLLRGPWIAPAIFVAAFAANAMTAGSLATSAAVAAGNTLEAVVGGYLINRWSDGRNTFMTPGGVVRFSLVCCLATEISATIGVMSLALAGFADWSSFASIWLTWWVGDLAGALVITPVIVLWAGSRRDSLRHPELTVSFAVFAGASAIGIIAFSPMFEQIGQRTPLGFLAVVPLLWSALRGGPRDTATVALILSCFAVWATVSSGGPFGQDNINESFLVLVMFIISMAIPSLALSADAAVRKRAEEKLRRARDDLNRRVEARTAALGSTNRALKEEIERRKRAEAELGEQKVHLLEAQRLANLGSWVRDVENNKIVWSDQLYDIFGMKRGEPLGSFEDYLGRIHPDDRERVRAEVAAAMRSGEGFDAERRIVRPNGEVRYLQTRVEIIEDDQGRVVRMLGVGLDVTERREAEMALERTREQLAQGQKMEAIGQLTGGIAHDFNNLLMIISGHADMLRRRLSEPKALQGIDSIRNAARRGESLTRQLLTFSRRQPLNPVPVDLRQRIETMRSMLGSSLRGNINLVIDIPHDVWPVAVDVAELELALVNIAVNARDAMPEGGTFTVTARNVVAEPGRMASLPARDCVELVLSDSGEGIAPEIIKKVFDPFFTTKVVGKGTGLGLSQVYGFALQSGGTVNVASEVGSGSTITLTLPRSHGAVTTVPEPAGESSPVRAEGTILVVEDNPDVGEVTATLLEQNGYRVLRAENAAGALAELHGGIQIDLVISDIVMPGNMNGIHLAQEVQEHFPEIRVLLTTGYSDMAMAAESRFPILRKPFELPVLERAVRDALAGSSRPAARRA